MCVQVKIVARRGGFKRYTPSYLLATAPLDSADARRGTVIAHQRKLLQTRWCWG
jgi:hypothetical protein